LALLVFVLAPVEPVEPVVFEFAEPVAFEVFALVVLVGLVGLVGQFEHKALEKLELVAVAQVGPAVLVVFEQVVLVAFA